MRTHEPKVALNDHENEILGAVVNGGFGYTDKPSVLRTIGVQGARNLLMQSKPARLAEIDQRHEGKA